VIPVRRKKEDATPVFRHKRQLEFAVSLSTMMVLSAAVHESPGAHVPVVVLCPWIVKFVFPDGTVRVTWLVQLHVPAGILTVVVELVTALNAV
jgi:hypothetical protein